mgnify:CR=1 FL=1
MNDKELVAKHAAQRVQNGMVVGLGTGSTANYFIDELARRVKDENLLLKVISSSVVSSVKAQSLGLALVAIEHIRQLDLYVDGADEVTAENTLLKGQGADLVKEKLLANASTEFIVLVDQSKIVKKIGEKFPIPIEVTPFAWQIVKYQLEDLGGQGQLRQNANGGMAVSSHGSLILDMTFPASLNSQQLDDLLNDMPGVVEHGIFYSLAKTVLLAEKGDVKEIINTP